MREQILAEIKKIFLSKLSVESIMDRIEIQLNGYTIEEMHYRREIVFNYTLRVSELDVIIDKIKKEKKEIGIPLSA